ncbi:MAG: alpha/beta hydrolase [bacterium]|nr:alpha/beta hydrolase [bacterium]
MGARRSILLVSVLLLLVGCTPAAEWFGVRLLYDRADLPAERLLSGVAYRDDAGADPVKHRLDFFLPEGEGWPILVFVHGGGWTAGDKSLNVSGADVYANIGRFYARQGIGTAVINYRLQPGATWREQVDDVARAVAWVREHAPAHGGDPESIFLMGHSAGAQLAAYVALDARALDMYGLSPGDLCGVVPVSGAGYDLADEETYDLGAERAWYEERFRAGDPGDDWLRDASAITYVGPHAPPFLLVHVTNEWKSLHHQNRLLHAALQDAGATSELLVVEGSGHNRMVLTLSHANKKPVPEILEFVRRRECSSARAKMHAS